MAPTDREQQILSWITQNPMISQNELAELCGITRSGVAAHISNLVKKGYIRGKGYIVTPASHVTVIGGINMDIYGVAENELVGSSSNVGHISFSLGGIARNVAFDLTRLGVANYLISVYGDDHNGELFKEDALANGMDITYAKQLSHENTSTYLSVRSSDGRQLAGLDDMGISERITPGFLEERRHVIANSTYVVIDSSLSAEAIAWICGHCERPVFARVVSVNKAARLLPALPHLDTIVLSAAETAILSGVEARDEAGADECAARLLAQGVSNVFLFLDDVGMLYRSADERCFMPQPEGDRLLWYKNGAASAALAALVWARGECLDFTQSAHWASAAARMSMQCVASTNPALSVETLRAQLPMTGDCPPA